MAHSPTPGPSQFRRQSATPPLLSKRDKKRNAIETRIREINVSFMNHREAHSRAQLASISRDVNFINRADPYDLKPLEDYADDAGPEVLAYTGESMNRAIRSATVGLSDADSRPQLGKWASRFVEVVNDTMEIRDTELTEVVTRFQEKIDLLMEEHDFAIAVAMEEHKAMKQSIRERAIALVQSKKRALEKEKALLDVADSNTLLLHPSQFTITQPASPSGAPTNRKTRHTRHRLEVENIEANSDGSKRKRKAPTDFDNVSPGPVARGSIDAEAQYHWDRSYNGGDREAPTISIDRLFSSKELQMHTRSAIESVGNSWSKRSKPFVNTTSTYAALPSSQTPLDSHSNTEPAPAESQVAIVYANPPSEDEVDTTTLIAPLMERGGSYATRSTRKDETAQLYEGYEGGKQEAMKCFGFATIQAHLRMLRTKEDALPNTEPLTSSEIMYDIALFEAAKGSGMY